MSLIKNFFASSWGIILVGVIIGILAPLLQKLGNPGNMGICVACFNRDIAGALGLHRAGVVQYMRPEIIGFVLGALIASVMVKEYRPRGGSAPIVRFLLGMFAMIGALVFLGCPWRAILRLSAGDLNSILAIVGLAVGIWIGTLFLKSGYSLGRASRQSSLAGLIMPIVVIGFLIVMFIYPSPAEVPDDAGASIQVGQGLWYSLAGPGSMRAALFISLIVGLFVGVLAQRSRFCTMGAVRDLLLFKQMHLLNGVIALLVFAFITNLILQQFNLGFDGQPIAHTNHVWNFLGMALAGLAFALAGGCPGRQCFLAGEGDTDAGIFVIGMIVGAAFAHNFFMAAAPNSVVDDVIKVGGPGPNGIVAVIVGLAFCVIIGLTMRPVKKSQTT